MRHIPVALRQLAIERAGNRCEYCGLSQEGPATAFHIDHVIPLTEGGDTSEDNLALACVSCSLHKGARQRLTDPETGQETTVYNPRRQDCSDHFRWDDTHLVGLIPVGRATISALRMNRPIILAIRVEEAFFNRHPPPAKT